MANQSPSSAAGSTVQNESRNGETLIARGGDRHTIEIFAPRDGVYNDIRQKEDLIRIQVRELGGKELGALASPKLSEYADRAVERKSQEDKAAYGKTTKELREDATSQGYYSSPSHQAWAAAAEQRTGGRLTAAWWMKFDPYGGTAGNGPNIEPTGEYPGVLSKIAMGHDTDWSLGRHFQAGPLRGLYGAGHDAETRGLYGLDPSSPIEPSLGLRLYTNPLGHPDWKVNYTQGMRRADASDSPNNDIASAKTDVTGKDFGDRGEHFNKALSAANGNTDVAAAVLRSSAAAGHDPNGDFRVELSSKGALIPAQGAGPGVNRGDGVVASQVQPGTAQNVAEALTQRNPTQQQVAAVEPERQTQAPRTV
jgi:hypothetical protein